MARTLKEAEVPGLPVPWLIYTPERRPANAEERLADGKSSIALASTLVTLPVTLPFSAYHNLLLQLHLTPASLQLK